MEQYGCFINNQWREPRSKAYFTTINPGTEEPLAQVAQGSREDAQDAIAAARKAFDHGPWPRMSQEERVERMHDLADKILAAADELAVLEAQDSGACIRRTQTVDGNQAAAYIREFADFSLDVKLREELPTNEMVGAERNMLLREPVGVCSAIIPWNWPLLAATWKIGPAIAMGNTCILKPASDTPLSARRLMECVRESAIPEGVINMVTGGGSTVGEELAGSMLVDKVAFTGSTEVGRRVMQLAASNIKKCTLELGGKSPNIVLDDADIDFAVDGSLFATFFHQGQICQSGTRLFLSENIHDEFVEKLVARTAAITIGDQMDFMTTMGPLINEAQRNIVEEYVNIGIDEGATLVCGGHRPEGEQFEKGFWYTPTIFTNVDNKSRLAQEEIFGPVLAVIKYTDLEDAIRMANDSPYGLAGGVWTNDLDKGRELCSRIAAGTVWINDWHQLTTQYPFGGYKQSGIGRELGGTISLESYTEEKHVHVSKAQREMKMWFNMTVN